MFPKFPLECVLDGNPRSLQAKPEGLKAWKSRVSAAVRAELDPPVFLSGDPLRFTLIWFASDETSGDLDNVIKPILDAAIHVIMLDDRQVHSINAEIYPPSRPETFRAVSAGLVEALERARPCVYIRFEERA